MTLSLLPSLCYLDGRRMEGKVGDGASQCPGGAFADQPAKPGQEHLAWKVVLKLLVSKPLPLGVCVSMCKVG